MMRMLVCITIQSSENLGFKEREIERERKFTLLSGHRLNCSHHICTLLNDFISENLERASFPILSPAKLTQLNITIKLLTNSY